MAISLYKLLSRRLNAFFKLSQKLEYISVEAISIFFPEVN